MDCLGIFAKYWEPGKVKTRLAATLGNELASDLYRHFLATLARRFNRCADRRILCFTPLEEAKAFHKFAGEDWITRPQSPGDLGSRITAFFESCFQEGAQHVVLIGSDSPTLPAERIESAFDVLQTNDVVLGPADDGGYYLVGASRNVTGLFDGIDWSTQRVWEQTLARLGMLRYSYETLPPWYDVDELKDLIRLRDELSQSLRNDPAFSDLRAAIERAD